VLRTFTEYASKNHLGIRIEAASMAKNDTLWMPGLDSSECVFPFLSLQNQGQTHAEKNPTVRIVHAAQLRESAPWLTKLLQFEIHDRVGENERSGGPVEKCELLEDAAGNKRLIDFARPFFRRIFAKIPREVDIYVPRIGSLAHAG
jgi:hypothetical protein